MRVRAAAFVLLVLLATACSGKRTRIADPQSLRILNHLSAKQSSFGVILDAKTGKALAAFPVNNPISAAIPDGRGGWFIGGGFIRVDGQLRKRLAHIRADGTLDPDWRPEVNGNGVGVSSLARIGSRIYVAGDFERLDHSPRRHLGAVDARTGKFDRGWRPSGASALWNNVLLAAGHRLIVGGGSCCSEAQSSLGALDAKTGAVDRTWRPRVDSASLEGGGVYLLAGNGSGIIVGGVFKAVDGVRRAAVAEIDSKTGRLLRRWRPRISGGSCPWCALFAAQAGGNRVYASINGPARYPVVAFDRQTGDLDRHWHATVASTTGFYGAASATALAAAGSRVYIAGDFDTVNGRRRKGFAALDPKTARVLTSWTPRANSANATLLAPSGSHLLLGVGLSREVSFDFTGLKTFVPVRRLRLVLALSGPGSVRIGVGRTCNYERWTETARCGGRVFRWLGSVQFPNAQRKRYTRNLGLTAGRYFVRFLPRADSGPPQPPYDFPIRVPPRKVR
jgi:outer membrane protein assembly factor BamB